MPATLLNVDDHQPGRYARTRFLTRAGFEVAEAATGKEALEAIKARKPDLVLLDINLPDINGFEVCRSIKSDPECERIPVIFLSASRLADGDVVQGLEVGGDNYLREPVEPEVLIATVRALLRAREAEEELARSNEQLRRFAFVVSHELQEPLRMVKSYTQLLARKFQDTLNEDAREYVGFTVSGVERMEKFISDMLTFAQSVEADLEIRSMTVRSAVDIALLELDQHIRDSAAAIDICQLPVVNADVMRLAQVFRNLIANAIKYRSIEPPSIRISASGGEAEWVFSVKDNGVGIDPKYADTVFTIFKRLHGRETPGSGVGLAICKEIVERHGGRIWVESVPGQGSDFRFTLPKPR